MDARAAVAVRIHREDVGQAIPVDVRRGPLRLGHVEEAGGRRPDAGPSADRLKSARRRIEDVDLDLEVRVLVDHRDLVDAVGACEMSGEEARLRRIDLTGTGVVRATVAGVEETRSRGDQVEALELEVVDL